MCKIYNEYEYKIAMYIWDGYTTFFQLKEFENGQIVPIRRLSKSPGEVSYSGSVEIAIRVAESLQKCDSKKYCPQGLNMYQELMGISSLSQEVIDNERLFWENVICIHFYRRLNGEYTITALQRGDNLCNYIKKIHTPNNYSGGEFQDVVLELIQEVHNYRENPEETPVNIEEYRKDESVGKHRFPWHISIYKGEKRLLIIPYLDHKAGFRRQPDKMVILDENAGAEEIGNGIMEVIEIMKSSPRLVGNTQGYRLATKYKGWKSFSKRNKLVTVLVNEDFSYKIYAEECPKSDGIYCIMGDEKNIESDITVEGLGKCIIECFEVFCLANDMGKSEKECL